jgi:hypothetical protein
MPTNMPEPASILSPTGTVLNPNLVLTGVNGTNTNVGYVTQPVPGTLLNTAGIGEFVVSHGGLRGTMTAEILAGATGSARALMLLCDVAATPIFAVQITLDSTNRPGCTIISGGTAVATWSPAAPAYAAGDQVQVRLTWDSKNTLDNGLHANFELFNGAAPGGSWSVVPSAPFAMLPMSVMLTGYAPTLGDFNGTVRRFQVGDQI